MSSTLRAGVLYRAILGPQHGRLLVRRQALGLTVIALLLFSILHLSLSQAVFAYHQPVGTAQPYVIYSPHPASTTPPASPSSSVPAAGTAVHPSSSQVVIPPIPACNPYLGPIAPAALNLDSTQPGLTQRIEPPSYYQVHGYNADQVEVQIARCAPGASSTTNAEFTAETSYRLSWQYGFAVTPDGQCTLNGIKLGLHITMVLPVWSANAYSAAGFKASWQHFITSLTTHETGHQTLDVHYASQMLADLQKLPPTDCATIKSTADAVISNDLQVLNQANDGYDASTNHGATQGAVLR